MLMDRLLSAEVAVPRVGMRGVQLQAATQRGADNVAAYLAGLELERIATVVRQLRELLVSRTWTYDRRALICGDIERCLVEATRLREERQRLLERSSLARVR